MEKHGHDVLEQGGGKKSNEQPIKILTSGKFVGNVGEQWREVRDNRVKNNTKQEYNQGKTGNKIVPVEQGVRQHVETTNKFAALEVIEGDKEENNQLAIVEEVTAHRNPDPTVQRISNPKGDGRLNAVTVSFNPTPAGSELRGDTVTIHKGNGINDQLTKESIVEWVQRAFVGNKVTVNTSCQEIPSQETHVVEEMG